MNGEMRRSALIDIVVKWFFIFHTQQLLHFHIFFLSLLQYLQVIVYNIFISWYTYESEGLSRSCKILFIKSYKLIFNFFSETENKGL